jgi:hypothetical protein
VTEKNSSTLDQYRAAKADYLRFRADAKRELVRRFHELANELLRTQQELLDDFGEKIAIPSKPKRGKPGAKTVAKKSAKSAPVPAAAAPSAKVEVIQRKLATQKKKLEQARAAGKPLKSIEDHLYELEDELRLAREA